MPTEPTITNWRDVMLRMQQLGRRHSCAIVTVTVMVEHGEPVHWDEPAVTAIEPGRLARAFVDRLRGVKGNGPHRKGSE